MDLEKLGARGRYFLGLMYAAQIIRGMRYDARRPGPPCKSPALMKIIINPNINTLQYSLLSYHLLHPCNPPSPNVTSMPRSPDEREKRTKKKETKEITAVCSVLVLSDYLQ